MLPALPHALRQASDFDACLILGGVVGLVRRTERLSCEVSELRELARGEVDVLTSELDTPVLARRAELLSVGPVEISYSLDSRLPRNITPSFVRRDRRGCKNGAR